MSNTSSQPSLAPVTAVILAGGLGARLRSVVADQPKVIADVCGQPFLTFLLEQITAAGVEQAVLCTGYKGEQVRETLGETFGPLRLAYSAEQRPLDTAGALRLALPMFASETLLVMNGDSYCDVNLREFWQWHREKKARASMVITEVADTSRHGLVLTDSQDRVMSFAEKQPRSGAGWINAGVYLLARELIEAIPQQVAVSLERTMFPAWIESGLYAFRGARRFLDIGTPESFALAQQFFTAHPAT